ncbi:MAG TPA: hypothetical protein VFA85_17105 [Terriglobales bacterium]|nr:hypothetical protein [Terriglobales bacterium]
MARRNAIPRSTREHEARERALAALALMRREGKSRSAAAKAKGTTPAAIDRYAGSALRQDRRGGRYRATPWDRIPRYVKFPTPHGEILLTVRDSRTASLISEHRIALGAYVRGDESALNKFRGASFRVDGKTYTFMTDPGEIAHLAAAGELPVEGLYQAIAAA